MSILRNVLIVATVGLPLSASAGGLAGVLEALLVGGGKTAAKIAAEDSLSASRTFSRTIFAETRLGSVGVHETDQFERTIARMGQSSPEMLNPRLDALKSVFAQVETGLHPLTHTATFDDALPFMRIRATGDARLDDALAAFARAKFEPILKERFSVDDLRIVALGMSEDAPTSAKEVGRYNRWIPAAQQDRVGSMAQLARGELTDLGEQGLAELFVPYRGKTVVLVGHVPESTQAFFVMTPQGMKSIDLDLLMKTANRAEVNIIPIGCQSGRFAAIGAVQDINSDDVLQRLVGIIQDKPSTIRDFFKGLSGSDLDLVLDPTQLDVFNNTMSIVKKESNQAVGRIATNVGRQASRLITRRSAPTYDPCFQEADAQGFSSCSRRIEANFKASVEADQARKIEAYRSQRVRQIPEELVEIRHVTLSAARAWALGVLLYLPIWVLAVLIGPYAAVVMRNQNDTGEPLGRLIVNREVVVQFLRSIANPAFWRANARLGLWVAPPLVVGLLVLLAGPYPDGMIPAAAGIGSLIVVWFCVMTLWNWVKSEERGAGALAAVVVLAWVGGGWLYHQSAEPFWEAEARVSDLKAELYAYTHHAQSEWRQYLPSDLASDID